MTLKDAIEWVLLALGTGIEVVCSIGVLLARDAFDRLHFAAAGAAAGPLPIALAVVVRESFTQPALNALLVAFVLLFLGPLLAIGTARAARRALVGTVEARSVEARGER
jgi:multisubunit Na+/H+ antiporter MnhG subunit